MTIDLILVPYDSGRRGERMGAGPERLVAAGLPTALERAGHRVRATTLALPADVWPSEARAAFTLARLIAERVHAAREAGAFPIVLAGNCMSTVGVVAALGADARVVWLDAHGDFNTPETTGGGFLDGMALAAMTGRCWTRVAREVAGLAPLREERVWLLGARDLDPEEGAALRASAVRLVPAAEVGAATAGAIAAACAEDGASLHVHLDLDVLDPAEGRVNRYATAGGVSLESLRALLGGLAARAPVAALTLSAYDPSFDDDARVARAAIAAVESVVASRGGMSSSPRQRGSRRMSGPPPSRG